MAEFPRDYMTAVDAHRALGISRARTYQLINMGKLPSVKHRKRVYVLTKAVEERISWQTDLDKKCVSTYEVAEFFGVHWQTVRDWVGKELLHPHTDGWGRWCHEIEEIVKFRPPGYGRSSGSRPATRTLRGVYYPEPEEWGNG